MRRRAGQRRTGLALALVAALAAATGIACYATHLLRRSELQTVDARFSIRGKQSAPSNIVLVLIDPRTLEEMRNLHANESEFPFPRHFDGELIDSLRAAGAKVIALDLEYSHATDEKNDNALIEALSRAHGKTVLATTEIGPHGSNPVLGGSAKLLQEIGARAAEVRFPVDPDGVIRRFSYAVSELDSFAVTATELYTGKRIRASRFGSGTLPIAFRGPPETFTSISFTRVLEHDYQPSLFAGKIVIVGASAPILQDVHATATSGTTLMAGPEIHANAMDTLLRGDPLAEASGVLNIALVTLMAFAVPLGSLRLRRWRSLFDAAALATAFTVAVQLAFNSGLIVAFVYPLLALTLGTLGTLAVLYVSEALERERVRSLFGRFVPKDVVDEVLEGTDDDLRLGGVERECTVLFSDLRGFTSFSETQPAARVIDVVNHYLNEMTEAILAAGGTLISYMGDGIMAVFGAPLTQDDHADRALAAAREMIGPRLDKFNDWLAGEGFDRRFEMGVGLNSGPVMAGTVGSKERMEYTAIGDTTNTASRLEGLTKGSAAMLFISESTRARMRNPPEDLVPAGEFDVRGRTQRLAVWTIAPSAEADAEVKETVPEPSGSRSNVV